MQTFSLFGVTLTLVFAFLTGVQAGCSGRVSDRSIEPITQAGVSKRLKSTKKNTLILDARDNASFNAGHLKGARRTTLSEIDLTDKTPRFPGFDLVVVYGQNPGSATARALVKRLLQTGHKNVALLEGGYDAWVGAGLPVER